MMGHKKPFLHDTGALLLSGTVVKSELAGQCGGSFLLVSMSILHSIVVEAPLSPGAKHCTMVLEVLSIIFLSLNCGIS